MKNTFYITTAIDYASGSPHLGHAYEKIGADVLARWNRLIKNDTFFLTGTDEHGQKIVECAKDVNKTPKEFVDEKAKEFQELSKTLNLSNDFFIRTTNKDHKSYVQKMLQKSFDKGDIYLGEYEGLYCIGCERYYKEDELEEGNICPDHKKKVETIKEKNYFFKLSKYEKQLLELYEKNEHFISPKTRKSEVINRVKEGLQDISVSRPKTSLDWGIEFPFDKDHVNYVWFDALFNYRSAVQGKEKYWPANIHIIGKDIMWFHMVYWPAFLMSVGEELPDRVHAHGMILDEQGHKMSKSIGNVINPFEEIKNFGLDEFRYYLIALGGFGDDLKYSRNSFIEKINNDLNNDFGNLVSRVHSMTQRYFDCVIPNDYIETEAETNFLKKCDFFKEFDTLMQNVELHKAVELVFNSIRDCNAYINLVEPWKEQDKKRLSTIMIVLLKAVKMYGEFLTPIMPQKCELLKKQFNFSDDSFGKIVSSFKKGHTLGTKENLFSKVKKEEKKPESKKKKEQPKKKKGEKIKFSDLNLRVGKIISVEQHPNAEKLYVEKIDIGEDEPRQIISGLKDYYSEDEMKGRVVIVVANLKPAKLRGVKSEGMVLLAENAKGELGFLESNDKVGTHLTCGDEHANSDSRITIDEFFTLKIESKGTHVEVEGKKLTTKESSVVVEKDIIGEVR